MLDVATGTGIIAIAAAQAVGREGQVIGVYFSGGMLGQAQQKIQELGLQNVKLIEADAETVKFEDESFDVILCSSAIVYFKDIQATLQNWYYWLKIGGILDFHLARISRVKHPVSLKSLPSMESQYRISMSQPKPLNDAESC